MQRLILLGLNHKTAPLEVRERLAFNAEQCAAALAAFRDRFPEWEAVLLSTCNRVELYVARAPHEREREHELIGFLAGFHALAAAQFEPHVYRKSDLGVVEHLFLVVSSLDSMVLGETQILGQVREAYEAARRVGCAGTVLNPLFQRAIAVGKQVIHQTPLAEGRVSVASVAVDYARRIFERFHDKTVLSIGAGKMATLLLQGFVGLAPGKLLVCNRNVERAEALAARFGGQPVALDDLAQHLVAADIVVTSTGAPHPIVGRTQFETILRQRRYRPIFLIDIAVPRDVEASVAQLENVYLYNLDDLQRVVMQGRLQRRDAVAAARRIVDEQVNEFAAWQRQRELGPSIHRLYRRYHAVAQEELARTLNKLPNVSDSERAHLEDLARRIVNKLLHDPVQVLRRSENAHVPMSQYLHAMEKLFQLEADEHGNGGDGDNGAPVDPSGADPATGKGE